MHLSPENQRLPATFLHTGETWSTDEDFWGPWIGGFDLGNFVHSLGQESFLKANFQRLVIAEPLTRILTKM